MIKKIWLILIILFFQGCSDFIDAINNLELPEWEAEMSFHLLEKKVLLIDEIVDNATFAYDCIDTTFCDTSRGQYYVMEINDTIPTITVGDSLVFNDIYKSFNQTIDDVEISPLTTNLNTEIGIISLGEMPPQNTPEFTFNQIMPAEIISIADIAILTGNPIEVPGSVIEPVEQEFTFSSFSQAEISTSSIQMVITNNMFITLGDTIDIELRNIASNELLGNVSFYQAIPSGGSATETMNLNNVTLPGTIKIIINGKTLGTEGNEVNISNSDLNSGFYVSISVIEMEVLSATANIPTQTLEKSGKFEVSQSNNQMDLVSALIQSGFLELSVNNGIPLNSELIMSIPGLTNEDGIFSTTFSIDAAIGNSPTTTSITPLTLSDYTIDLSSDSLEYIYTVTTNPDSVTIDHSNMVEVELTLQGADNSGITFSSISGYFNEDIADSSSITLDSETKLVSAIIDSGQMKLTIDNGLDIDANINFTLLEFLDNSNLPLHSEIPIGGGDSTTVHIIELSGYTIQFPESSPEDINSQNLNYISSVSFDSEILQEIDLNSSLGFNVEITGLSFESISGILSPITLQPEGDFSIPISLPETIGEYSEQLEGFNFYNPEIHLTIASTIEVPISINLNLNSYKVSTENSDDTLKSASYDTLLVIDPYLDENIFNLSNAESLLNIFPNSFSANVFADVGGGIAIGHINQTGQLGGAISVKIPLAFLIEDTLNLALDMSKVKPLDEKFLNIQHADIRSVISSTLDLNLDYSAYVYADTSDIIPLDTLFNNFAINSGDTVESYAEFDTTLFAHLINDTTYIKPILSIMSEYDEEGNPLPFIIYSTDSLNLDIIANMRVLIDSTLTAGGE